MTDEQINLEREMFEQWYRSERPDMHDPFERVISDERYASMETEWAWRAWMASAKLGQ